MHYCHYFAYLSIKMLIKKTRFNKWVPDLGVVRVPDEHLEDEGVVLGVVEQEPGKVLEWKYTIARYVMVSSSRPKITSRISRASSPIKSRKPCSAISK
jgi:hypothetical protein